MTSLLQHLKLDPDTRAPAVARHGYRSDRNRITFGSIISFLVIPTANNASCRQAMFRGLPHAETGELSYLASLGAVFGAGLSES